jgi:hypothetical protein
VDVEAPGGARHHAPLDEKEAGGESHPEERHGLAAEVLMIDRRQKIMVRRVSIQISIPNIVS